MADRTGRWLAGLVAVAFKQRRCQASGWGMHRSCTDSAGYAVCPYCEQRVATRADSVGAVPVQRIKVHAARALPLDRWLRPSAVEERSP